MKIEMESSIVRIAFTHKHYVIAMFIVLMLLGINAIVHLPIRLLPNITSNEIEIINDWPAASVEEMETQLVVPIEELLTNVSGLEEMASDIAEGWAVTTLKFSPSSDMDQIYIDVVNRVNQYSNRPQAAREPQIINNANGIQTAVATLLMFETDNLSGYNRDVVSKAFRQHVQPAIKSISGVDELITSFNPVDQRLDIVFDPAKLASFGLTVADLRITLQGSFDRSAGLIELGAREYNVRYKGRKSIEQLGELQIANVNGREIYLRDIASIQKNYFRSAGGAFRNGHQVLYIRVNQGVEVNSLDIMEELKEKVHYLNNHVLKDVGVEVSISRDDSKPINDAINLVQGSLLLGLFLATVILFAFIRQLRTILIIFCTVPMAIVVSALILQLSGRSLNVISLAGIALSTGLIIDAAIVVVENILRYQKQKLASEAVIIKAVSEVSGALVTSVISSIIVFLPILYLQSEEGQLFKDLAVTISSALMASLIIAITFLPIICRHFLHQDAHNASSQLNQPNFKDAIAERITALAKPKRLRYSLVLVLIIGPILGGFWLLPAADILPNAKDRVVRAGLQFNEKMNLDALEDEVISVIVQRMEGHRKSGLEPLIDRFVFFYSPGGGTIYIYPEDPENSAEVITWFKEQVVNDIPSLSAFTRVAPLLRLVLRDRRSVIIDLQGEALPHLMQVAADGVKLIEKEFPQVSVNAMTSLSFNTTQVHMIPRGANIQAVGESRKDFGDVIRALNDGIFISDYFDNQRNIPLFLKGPDQNTLNDLLNTPIYTQSAGVQPLLQFVDTEFTNGPDALLRINGETTLSLEIHPAEDQAIETLIEDLRQEIEPLLREQLGEDGRISYRGSAKKLEELLGVMVKQFSFALAILFLMMFAMFKSIRNALVVMLSLPIAIFGGVVALRFLNLFTNQSLDVMTMVGFVILLGLVINNTILFVSQLHQNSGSLHTAVFNTIKLRLRPIYMVTVTSIFGMLPLVLAPGIGAEIYRGLAAVIVGGMIFSAMFTLVLLTAMVHTPLYSHTKPQQSQSDSENVAVPKVDLI